jgi:hypothetical protein
VTQALSDKVEIRTSLRQTTAILIGSVALAAGLSFCSPRDPISPGTPAMPWVITGFALAGGLFYLVPALANRSPRIILDATGILWREGSNKIYESLSWPEIVSASIEPGDENEEKRLRLHLEPRSALERVASEGPRRWVDISIDTVDIHEGRLRRVINQFAPHLFTGAARSRVDLAAT